jgi:hypothetical protein
MVFISIIVYVIVILHIMVVNGNPNISGGGGGGGGEKNKNDLLTQLVDKLTNAKTIAQNSVNAIYKEWEVDKYPNFLKSCFMNKISWELLSLKYQKKIMEAYLFKDKKSVFVMSFTGR